MRPDELHAKVVATVADVSRLVGLSRERFYQLQRAGVFPMPLYDITTKRPFYNEDQQRVCVEVRRRNCGINGQPVLFYARAVPTSAQVSVKRRPPASQRLQRHDEHQWITDGMTGLGLDVNCAAATAAAKVCFPAGFAGVDRGKVIRDVFLYLKRQNPDDKVSR